MPLLCGLSLFRYKALSVLLVPLGCFVHKLVGSVGGLIPETFEVALKKSECWAASSVLGHRHVFAYAACRPAQARPVARGDIVPKTSCH